MNINEQAIHDMVGRQIDLMRYERSVRRELLAVLEKMRRQVEEKLARRDLDGLSRRELETLLAEIGEILQRDYDLAARILDTQQLAETEHTWLLWWLAGLAAAYGLHGKAHPMLETALHRLAQELTVGGLTVLEITARQRDDLLARIKAAARMAAIGGGRADTESLFARAGRQLQTTSRTWVSSVQAAVYDGFGRLNPWVRGWRHIAVLDGHTSSVCTHRHGLLWDKAGNPVGHDTPFVRPPLHPNCRSRLVYVFDMGKPFDGISGADWVKSRSLAQLQAQFGATVGQMLAEERITLADAVSADGLKPLTASQLQQKTR